MIEYNTVNTEKQTRFHILVVDDEEPVRDVLSQGIKLEGYECSTAPSAEEALEILEKDGVDVIIADIQMHGMNGIELTKKVKEQYDSDVIVMTGYFEDLAYDEVIETGASDFVKKPIEIREMNIRLKRVLNERTVRSERDRAEENLRLSLQKYEKAIEGIVHAMALTVEMRDPYTAGHQRRVSRLSWAMAREIGFTSDQIHGIRIAGNIHDVGKLSVPAEILSKPGKLTEIEFDLIKAHCKVGYDILKNIEFSWPIAQIVLQHHERMDGSGYPQGLTGKAIMPEARIIAVADVVEAMASHRPYRPAPGIDKALQVISKYKGKLYDGEAVEACHSLFSEGKFHFD